MVITLFCLIRASARATFAGLFVWLAEPARSLAPHFDGAHFSSSGLSDTGPFRVWVPAGPANASTAAITIALAMTLRLMDISSVGWLRAGCDVSRRSRAPRIAGCSAMALG